MLARIRKFLSTDLWLINVDSLPRFPRGFYGALQTALYVWKEFWRDNGLLRASALTYTTLLSVVPLLALMFALLKGLGVQRALEPFVLERLTAGSQALAERLLVYVDRIHVGSLGTLGITFLFATMILVLTNIEMAFNQIWKVERGRPWLRKCSDYLGLLVILPVAMFVALSLTTFVKSHAVTRELLSIDFFGRLYVYLLKIAPFFVMWLAFSFVYLFMPNTRVNPISASAGGIVGGTLWQLSQWAYVHYQFGFGNYSAIYGALSQLPMLLIWIFVSWVILLLGAEISFSHQNLAIYRLQQRWQAQPIGNQSYWGLHILLLVYERFSVGKPPPTVMDLAQRLQLPVEETKQLVNRLQNLGALRVSGDNGCEVLPVKDMKHLVVFDLVEGLENRKVINRNAVTDGYGKLIVEVLDRVREQGREGVDGLTVADLLVKATEECGDEVTDWFAEASEEFARAAKEFDESSEDLDGGQAEK
ncbi:MAG: YihY/virulence factor BrkB family protein [Deltaproteobacteria bacterium]|nr:MAG: YihY/virulence factor BrkB family protein [Deltaproteobacteria bacterium]